MKKIHILLGVLFLSLASCEITDENIDQNNPSGDQVNAGAVYPGMITQSHRNSVALNARIAGIITQQYLGIDAQQIAYDQYNINEDDSDDYWDAALYGTGAMPDAFGIYTTNEGEVGALAKLYMAYNLGMATSTWGDVPFTDAFVGDTGNFTPTYDSQVDIYTTIQRLLDESIADGVSSGIGEFLGVGNGSPDWERTARALKARHFIHLTSVDNSAATSALAQARLALTSTAQQADFVYSLPTQNANPLFVFSRQRPGTLSVSPQLITLMNGDPRLPLYTDSDNNFAGTGLFWGRAESPTPLISYWEVKFIEAEALVRTSGTDVEALAALRAAVEANMLYVGVSPTDASAYTANLALTGTMSNKIQTIITEKYKAFFGNSSIEAWTDYRRTGFPTLSPNPDAVGGVNPSRIIPRRLLYPISERLTNLENYNAAISAQGGQLLDVDLFAFPR
jgi:hypothetical protein